jgi:hypothetical protein
MRHQLELHDAAARLQAGVHQTAAVSTSANMKISTLALSVTARE